MTVAHALLLIGHATAALLATGLAALLAHAFPQAVLFEGWSQGHEVEQLARASRLARWVGRVSFLVVACCLWWRW